MFGGIVGDSIGTAKRGEKDAILRADQLEQELDRHAHRAGESERAHRRR